MGNTQPLAVTFVEGQYITMILKIRGILQLTCTFLVPAPRMEWAHVFWSGQDSRHIGRDGITMKAWILLIVNAQADDSLELEYKVLEVPKGVLAVFL